MVWNASKNAFSMVFEYVCLLSTVHFFGGRADKVKNFNKNFAKNNTKNIKNYF